MSKITQQNIYLPRKLLVEIRKFANAKIIWFCGPYNIKKIKIPNFVELIVNKRIQNNLMYQLPINTYLSAFYKCDKYQTIQKENVLHSNSSVYLQQHIAASLVGFKKYLRLRGVGYAFSNKIKYILQTEVGYSHPVLSVILSEFVVKLSSKFTKVKLKSYNLMLLTHFLSYLRKQRFPEVYKGKGIRYRRDTARIKKIKKKKTF
jgi:ribosomal protein L6P/L9E